MVKHEIREDPTGEDGPIANGAPAGQAEDPAPHAPLDEQNLDEHGFDEYGNESVVDLGRLAHRLQGLSRRYLLQIRCNAGFANQAHDPTGALLAALAKPIGVIGGQIEEHWSASSEYDLILIVRLPSHQVSLAALEMALTAMPEVRALRSTALFSLDPPVDEDHANWRGMIADELASGGVELPSGADDDGSQLPLTLELLRSDD